MTPNEKFHNICEFKRIQGPLRWYAFTTWPGLEQKWHEENAFPLGSDIKSFFKLEGPLMVPGNPGMSGIPYSPAFQDTILEDLGEAVIARDNMGIICKRLKENASISQCISFPVTCQKDWEALKERLDPKTHDKGPDYDETSKLFRTNSETNCLFINGVFGFMRSLFGEVNLSYAFYDQPELLYMIGEHWLKFYAAICERLIKDMRVDYVMFFEDIAYNRGPLVSPEIFRKFFSPYFKELIDYLKTLGMKYFMVDTDGNVDIILPLYLECGINMMDPFEQAAGNNIIEIGQKYEGLILWGGLDKRVLNGTKDDIKREVYSKVPAMLSRGGYIPSIDHLMLQPCPMENFECFIESIDEICLG